MTMIIKTAKIQKLTRQEWEDANPVLYDGTLVYERDTERFKMGDGKSTYIELDYLVDPHVSMLCSEILVNSKMRDVISIISFINAIIIWGLLSLINYVSDLKFVCQLSGFGFIYFILTLFFNSLLTKKKK